MSDLMCDVTDFFVWEPVPGASAYDVEVMHEGTGAPLSSVQVIEPRILVGAVVSGPAFEGVDRGSLMLHIRARDVLGPGEWSVNQPFFVNPPTIVGVVSVEVA